LLVAGPGTRASAAVNADKPRTGDGADVERVATGPDRDRSTTIVNGTATAAIRTTAMTRTRLVGVDVAAASSSSIGFGPASSDTAAAFHAPALEADSGRVAQPPLVTYAATTVIVQRHTLPRSRAVPGTDKIGGGE
jgi:hypothetical protein